MPKWWVEGPARGTRAYQGVQTVMTLRSLMQTGEAFAGLTASITMRVVVRTNKRLTFIAAHLSSSKIGKNLIRASQPVNSGCPSIP